MSKTPEEMAEEYLRKMWGNDGDATEEMKCVSDFLAGYNTAQQWIAVKDRLPEVGQDVLVWYHGSCCTAYLQKVKSVKLQPPQFNNVEMFEWCFGDFEDFDVTHWMPLPTPPKEEA